MTIPGKVILAKPTTLGIALERFAQRRNVPDVVEGARANAPQWDWGLNSIGCVVSTGPAADRQLDRL